MEEVEKIPSTKKTAKPTLPDDLIRYILELLPARSICRFRSVSKPWCAMLTDEEFISGMQDVSSFELEVQDQSLIRYIYAGSVDSPHKRRPRSEILMPHNQNIPVATELIAYRFSQDFICYRCDQKHLYVMDLLTGNSYLLPSLPFSDFNFDFEFGFDPKSKHYKLLVWSDGTTPCNFHLLTFTRSSIALIPASTWRRPSGIPLLMNGPFQRSFVTSKGFCYLLNQNGNQVLSFNLESEQFGALELPIVLHNENHVVQHPSMVEDQFPDEFQQSGKLYDQDIAFKEYEIPRSVYQAYLTKPMVQSDFSYSLFEYDQCLALSETCSFESAIGFKQFAISGIWLLNEVKMTWSHIMGKTTPPVSGLPGSKIWMKKHSKFVSTRRGEIVLTASKHDTHYIMIYDFFDRSFKTMVISSESTSANAACIEAL